MVQLTLGRGALPQGYVGPGQGQNVVECPKEMVGRIIGRGGETIKGLQAQTGARVQIDQAGEHSTGDESPPLLLSPPRPALNLLLSPPLSSSLLHAPLVFMRYEQSPRR